jgi:hypothetical protein
LTEVSLRPTLDTRRSTAKTIGRIEMAIFVMQGRFTREYIRGGLAKPEDRQAAIARLFEQAGKVAGSYKPMGAS